MTNSPYNQDMLIQQALIDYYAQEYEKYEQLTSDVPEHTFSTEFTRRIRTVFKASEKKYISLSRLRLRRAAVIAAAIIMVLASTVATLAVVRPQILFDITRRATNWMIEFRQEGTEEGAGKFTRITPRTPDGYYIRNEEYLDDIEYYIEYTDGEGGFIRYTQATSDGSIAYLDADDIQIERDTIDGHEVITSVDDQLSAVFFEDGEYIYNIDGNCDADQLMQIAIEILNR